MYVRWNALAEPVRLPADNQDEGKAPLMRSLESVKITLNGLRYLALSSAGEFGKQFEALGFGVHAVQLDELIAGSYNTLRIGGDGLSHTMRISPGTLDRVVTAVAYDGVKARRSGDLRKLVNACAVH